MRLIHQVLLAAAFALTVSVLPAAAQAQASATDAMAVTGEQTVAQTTELTSLRIAENGLLAAPEGKSLTMTVDGVQRDIEPGTYSGEVVLTVTPERLVQFRRGDGGQSFRQAILIEDNEFVRDRSVPAAILSGTVGDERADNLVLRSEGDDFNGVIVSGDSNYMLQSPDITVIGDDNRNGWSGGGAGIKVTDQAELTIRDGLIDAQGVIRPAIFVDRNAKLNVFDTRINVREGVHPADYVPSFGEGKGLRSVPWPMGISGNNRAVVILENAEVYFKRSIIRSEGWGSVSVDGTKRIRVLVEDSLIENIDSGYGGFSIGDSIGTYRNSRFEVADVGLIMAERGSAHFTDGTVVNSRRFGVMMFWYPRAGTLRIDKKSVFNTASTAIQIRDVGGTVIIDDAELNPGNGILIQTMPDDTGLRPGFPPPDSPLPPMQPADPDVLVSISNAKLTGDIVNGRTEQGDLRLTLDKATVTGRISTTIVSPATDEKPSAERPRLVGEVKNQYTATEHPYGLHLNLHANSRWVVTGASYLTALTIEPGAEVVGPDGKPAKLTVNGESVDAGKPGSYVGAIVVSPS